LDAADDVHLIDELWDPGEDEQAEDRAHRVSRIHQVTVFTYRTLGTIDEDIAMTKWEKKETHSLILDIRRKALARTHVTQDSGEL
jgi:SNF2 family DNA or RNA helicase